jgi:tetratricopeptide (TPR) repeat protein
LCSQALEAQPRNARAYFYRAVSLSQLPDRHNAFQDFDQALRLGMPPKAVLLAMPGACLNGNDYSKAADYCRQIFNQGLADDAAYLTRGIIYHRAGDKQTALADLNAACRSSDNDLKSRALIERASVYQDLADRAGALADLDASIGLSSSQAALIRRADLQRDMKMYRRAIWDYDAALSEEPSSADLFVGRGICESALGDRDDALDDFNSALTLKPGFVEALLRRGQVYKQLGKVKEADADFELAGKFNPSAFDKQPPVDETAVGNNKH